MMAKNKRINILNELHSNGIIKEQIKEHKDILNLKSSISYKLNEITSDNNDKMALTHYEPEIKKAIIHLRFHQGKEEIDYLLAIAHECRHIFQFEHIENYSKQLEDYNNDSTNLEKYNNQEVEIDANAYASLYLQAKYQIKPLFNNFSEDTKNKIQKKADEIYKELTSNK